jgi:hypothetical protein
MQFTLLNVLGILSPLILMATLRSIWREGQSRKLMLRMLPPERRPVCHDPKPLRLAHVRATSADRKQRAHPLWALRDCQMELLTESTMHAFEANATAYKPDRVASNYAPGGVLRRVALRRADADDADGTSILLRTLERSADMLSAGAAAMYGKPEIDHESMDTLSYIHPVQAVQVR